MEPIDRFRKAVTIKTDWPKDAQPGDVAAEAPLLAFQNFLADSYPAFHRVAERRVLSPYALVYRWPGGGDSLEKPILLLAHYDVVPVEAEKWTIDPFGAETKEGFIYGRGTLDMKGILIGIMEAAEALCARGFKPRRDIWFAFGGDEERTGILGALQTAKWFANKGICFAMVLDEGSPVAEGMIPGIDRPLALFSIEEKGFLSLDLTVQQKPGHASRPPETQAVATLAQALTRISQRPFPFRLTPTVESFFRGLSGLGSGPRAWAMAHARLLGGLFFKAAAAGSSDISALFRTTVAMTQLEGSVADNVMPSAVRAVLNLRLLPPWTIETAMARIREIVGDKAVAVTVHGFGSGPVPANPEHAKMGGPGWQEMIGALTAVYPGVPAFPFLMLATTDSRHYRDLAEGIFRFSPHLLNPRELALVHGHDERISVDNFVTGIRFYRALFEEM
ncbi:MAG: M20/M25/M40 family metallo-hydrolase [Spirochaetaceae bacterium]|nr:M20/M25/M40 family metallo-hydrolase [Spirochaetaceae bacterium]